MVGVPSVAARSAVLLLNACLAALAVAAPSHAEGLPEPVPGPVLPLPDAANPVIGATPPLPTLAYDGDGDGGTGSGEPAASGSGSSSPSAGGGHPDSRSAAAQSAPSPRGTSGPWSRPQPPPQASDAPAGEEGGLASPGPAASPQASGLAPPDSPRRAPDAPFVAVLAVFALGAWWRRR